MHVSEPSSMVDFSCVKCGEQLKALAEQAGLQTQCKGCLSFVTVPSAKRPAPTEKLFDEDAPPPLPTFNIINQGGQNLGQYNEAQVRIMLEEGKLSQSDLAWRDGLPDWVTLYKLFPDAIFAAVPHSNTSRSINHNHTPAVSAWTHSKIIPALLINTATALLVAVMFEINSHSGTGQFGRNVFLMIISPILLGSILGSLYGVIGLCMNKGFLRNFLTGISLTVIVSQFLRALMAIGSFSQ